MRLSAVICGCGGAFAAAIADDTLWWLRARAAAGGAGALWSGRPCALGYGAGGICGRVAARTYQVRQMQAAGSRAVLYDVGQAYLSEAEQKEKWGEGYALYAGKIHSAVRATAGEIMTYDGEPILAAFHAQSGGRTEDAAHVWNTAVPYLKSVDSKGDRQAPNNETTVTIAAKALAERLGIAEDAAVSVKKRTEAGYVAEVQAGSKTFSGREIRERLGLRSADFTIAKNGDSYIFTVHGYGHGAGMSQYGASFLAEQGKNYHEILRHYYTGISFSILE